jgi:hypothetical protein
LRLVFHDRIGPTTKADCLNRLYQALSEDEERSGYRARMVVIHDAEDMVDPAGLGLLDRAMDCADLVQLHVLPVPPPQNAWIGSHYCEEFAEAHGKAMVVRDALRAGMPLAVVGCAIGPDALAALARTKPDRVPFAADCLMDDYELGLGISAMGRTAPVPAVPPRKWQAGRDKSVSPCRARSCCPAKDPLDPRHRFSGMGPAWLAWPPCGNLDACPRSARSIDGVVAGAGLCAAGACASRLAAEPCGPGIQS